MAILIVILETVFVPFLEMADWKRQSYVLQGFGISFAISGTNRMDYFILLQK